MPSCLLRTEGKAGTLAEDKRNPRFPFPAIRVMIAERLPSGMLMGHKHH